MPDAKVIFLHGLNQKILDLITSYAPAGFDVVVINGEQSEQKQIKAIKDVDFLMVYRAHLSDPVLRAATQLRLIQLLAAGHNHMNLKLMGELGIPCASNGGANAWAVADHTVLLILAIYRRLIPADRAVRESRWRSPIDGFNTFELAKKTVGILGMGNIGQKVVMRLQGFGVTIQYSDKYPLTQEKEQSLGVKQVTLEELFQSSDIITCHAPLTPETHHIINKKSLSLMKPTAILINTSRGSIVDELALVAALQDRQIAGAGLDVFEMEPPVKNNVLLGMENVVLTAHNAGTTFDTWQRRAEFAYQNMQRVLDGQPPQAIAQNY
ncbi:MAG: 2-hydroxyacid dehydrogenase [Acidobacteriota bacterium]|nr:2-hydroxyacid dehydrogenase [Acidobacteriota bacterium]